MTQNNRGFGLIPGKADPRDYIFGAVYKAETLPTEYIPSKLPPVHDQGKFNNCAAHALSTYAEIILQHNKKYKEMSFPWVYGDRNHTDHYGEGLMARDMLKTVQKDGDLPLASYSKVEEMPAAWTTFKKLSPALMGQASKTKINNYYLCTTSDDVKKAVLKYGSVLTGCMLFKSFYNITKENIKMTEPIMVGDFALEDMLGGHMMTIVGWIDGYWIVMNSWGKEWGHDGFFLMPFSMMTWSERNGFPMNICECWAVDGLVVDGEVLTMDGEAPSPAPAKTGWYKQDGKWRYSENGKDLTGWIQVKGVWYYLDNNGWMKTGWLQEGGEWYYLQANGSMAAGVWQKIGGLWYWFNSTGKAVRGFQEIDGKIYCFASASYKGVKECQLLITDSNGAVQ